MSDAPLPRVFEDTHTWFRRINREFQFRPPADLTCAMDPSEVEAASGHTFTLTCTLGPDLTLPSGAHVTLEMPATWDTHLGNCFRRGVHAVGNRDQIQAGYGAWTDLRSSNPDVTLSHAASYGRILDLVDVVIVDGTLKPGDVLRFILGPEDGCRLQAQKFAQKALFPIAVDILGNGEYRRAAVFPSVTVFGAYPDRLRIFAPATLRSGASFQARLLPVDIYSYNPGTGYRGSPLIASTPGLALPGKIDIDTEIHPRGVSFEVESSPSGTEVHYLTACDPATGLAGRSNPIGVEFVPDHHIYFGEIHSQMWHSMGTGTTEEFFEWGRDNAGLDFCAPANHYNWRFEVTDEIWAELVDTCNAFNDPGRFATMVSYEWGGAGGSGHRNVYFKGDSAPFTYWYQGVHKNIREFWDSLAGQEALVAPHHLKAGCDWSDRSDTYQRFAEICSKWCISEEGGARSVQSALKLGHRIGLVGGTDTHYGLANQGSYHVNDGNGLACILAPELTRDAVWQALHDRRCYATTGDRILLHFSMDGHVMGTDLRVAMEESVTRSFSIRAAGTAPITAVDIIRNGRVVFTESPHADLWEGEWTDTAPLADLAFQPTFPGDTPFVYYYLRITQRNRQQAWSSPIWLTQATPAIT